MSDSLKIVLIGDLVGSRELSDAERSRCQDILRECLERINQRSGSLLSPFTITLGDEFQAVYGDSGMGELLTNCWEIVAELHALDVRFSIGIGEIVTPINEEQALGMDGPAFHCARDGMDQLKEKGQRFILTMPADSPSEPCGRNVVQLADGLLQLMSVSMHQWRKTRYQVLLMLIEQIPVKKIADRLKISETAVYKNINEGNLELVMELKHRIDKAVGGVLQ